MTKLPKLLAPSLRLLMRHKRFSALAIVSLAIGIALNTTMYGVLDTMIAPKLQIPDHERLYTLQFFGNYRRLISQDEYKSTVLEAFAFAEGLTGSTGSWTDRIVEGGGNVTEVTTVTVLPNYFRVLGVRPSAGRLLTAADVTLDSRPVVVSERLWKQLFPAQRRFEPATIIVGGEPRMMVGTLPYQADLPGANTGVWQLPPPDALATMPINLVRLKPGVTPEQVGAVLETLRLRFAQRTGEFRSGDSGFRFWRATQRPFRVNRFHFALVGSVFAVLLVACANLANLQLARGVARARELATRAAVGASRADIVRQLVAESAWLATGGLVLGAVMTAWGMALMDAYVPPQLFGYVAQPQVSWRVALFAVVATLFCLVLVGLAPALKLSRVDINELLKSGAGTGTSRSSRRQYGVLVAVEVALALSVGCSASLLLRAALDVLSFDGGLEGRGLVSTRVAVTPEGPDDRRTRQDWSTRLVRQALAAQGITNAAVIHPVSPKTRAIASDDAGGTAASHPTGFFWSYTVATSDYVRTMGLRIIHGRDFAAGGEPEPAVIVDRSTAAYLWPGASAVGRMIKLDSAHAPTPWLRVVGVADNMARWFNPNELERARAIKPHIGAVYVLQANDTARITAPEANRRYSVVFTLVVRGTGDPRKIPTVLRTALGDLGPRTFVSYPMTWEQQSGIDRLRARHGFMASLFMLWGLIALALAALGVYAILSHMVAQRTREFGVRIAVGAAARDIRELVTREGSVLTLTGIAVGLLLTAYSAGFVREFVFSDDDRYDSRVFALVCLGLFAVAWLASFVPARRAMRINPVEALRND